MARAEDVRPEGLKIAELVERTGVSRELIHHYLRQGLVPACEQRGRYDERQLALLRLIRRLRDEFHLPLETIRRVFELFDFEPGRLEPLFELEPLALRLERFVVDEDLGLGRTPTTDELIAAAGIDGSELQGLIDDGIIAPLDDADPPRFTAYDVHVAALCHQGTKLGIPRSAFRTVASYVRVGFQLQYEAFLELDLEQAGDAGRLMARIFARREITSTFVHNVLQSLLQRFVYGALGRPGSPRSSLDELVFRPSEAFLVRHGLITLREEQRRLTAEQPDDVATWLRSAEVMVHSGAYEEAAFALEQASQRWPGDSHVRALHGVALALSGQPESGLVQLQQARDDGQRGPGMLAWLALLRFRLTDGAPESLEQIRRLADAALAAVNGESAALQVRYLAAWLLTALPEAFAAPERGRELLAGLLDELPARELPGHLPGLRERHLLNTAWLLLEARERAGEDVEELRGLICRLDPACALAERAFLVGSR